MRKRSSSLLLIIILSGLVGVTPALAATIGPQGGAGTSPGDWNQEWNEAGAGNFDSMDLFIHTPGVYFSDPGSADSGFVATEVNSQYVALAGPPATSVYFNTDFTSDPSVSIDWYFYAFLGSNMVDCADASWDGANWTVTPMDISTGTVEFGSENASPEPATMLLLGSAFVFVGMFRFHRKK